MKLIKQNKRRLKFGKEQCEKQNAWGWGALGQKSSRMLLFQRAVSELLIASARRHPWAPYCSLCGLCRYRVVMARTWQSSSQA